MANTHVTVPLSALDWLFNGLTGLSSKAMCATFMGVPIEDIWWPVDAGDFGRCLKLLDTVPEWQGRVQEMADVAPEWAALVECWDELTALYRVGDYVPCTLRIRQALEEAQAKREASDEPQ